MQKPRLIDINNLIRQSEAARLLGVTKQAVNDRAKNKTITVVEIAGMKFVLRSELGLPKEKPKLMDVSDLIRQYQAARLRGVTRRPIIAQIRLGRLPAVEIAGLLFMRQSDVETFTYRSPDEYKVPEIAPRSRTLDYIREVFHVSQQEFERLLEDVDEPARSILRARSGFEPFKTHLWLKEHLGFNCKESVMYQEYRALERLRESLPKKGRKDEMCESAKDMIRQVRMFVGLPG